MDNNDGYSKLYRIISLESFLSLLLNKKERLVRPIDGWDDTFEGYMLHLLDTDRGRDTVLEKLYYNISDMLVDATIRNFSKLQRSRYVCYGLCWSKIKDSDALWRIYSYNKKGIQIISSKEKITTMCLNAGWDKKMFDVADVKYDIENEADAIDKILKRNSKIDNAYFHKRPAFKHEEEVRLLINDADNYTQIEEFSIKAIKRSYDKQEGVENNVERIRNAISSLSTSFKDNYRSIAPAEIFLNIGQLNQYVEGVRVHPNAEEWYTKLVANLCSRHHLKFEGKSDLYRGVE